MQKILYIFYEMNFEKKTNASRKVRDEGPMTFSLLIEHPKKVRMSQFPYFFPLTLQLNENLIHNYTIFIFRETKFDLENLVSSR